MDRDQKRQIQDIAKEVCARNESEMGSYSEQESTTVTPSKRKYVEDMARDICGRTGPQNKNEMTGEAGHNADALSKQTLKAAETLEPVKERERVALTLRKGKPPSGHSAVQEHSSAGGAIVQRSYNEESIEECVLNSSRRSQTDSSNQPIRQGDDTVEVQDNQGVEVRQKASGGAIDRKDIEQIIKDVCEGKDTQSVLSHVPTAEDLEHAHEEDLDLLEQAIAEKRMQIAAQIEMEHAQAKARLQARIEQLEHARLTQQHNFRSQYYKLQQRLEELNVQYERGLEEHERELERVATQEKTVTQTILNKIASTRAERERIAPELGRLDGALQLALSPETDRDEARIERGTLLDITRKLQDTVQNNAAEEQQLQNMAIEDMDIIMDEINNLEQELSEERALNEEARQAQANRLNDLRAQIAKAKRGPVNFEDEKKRLQEEVDALKLHWQTLRGHIEEHIEHTIEKTEKRKAEGRTRLMQQRAELYLERHQLGDLIKEANSKIYEEQKKVDDAKQFFEDRVKIKTKELNDQEDWHAERMMERTNRRDKRIKELDQKEQERAKRRTLEIQLLRNKHAKIEELFNIKKNHMTEAIKEAEERVIAVEEELNEPSKEACDKISGLQCALTEAIQKKTFLAEEKKLMKSVSKKELEIVQREGDTLRQAYTEQLDEKQKELVALRHAREKQEKNNERKLAHLDQKFGKQIDKLAKGNEKLEEYIDNLTREVDRLQRERNVLKEEYATQQEGIRAVIVEDETHIERERDKIHAELEKEREAHENAVDDANQKIQDARKQRHELAVQFKKDINDFAARAVSIGPSGSGSTEARATMLTTYQHQIQEYTKKVQAMNEKLKQLMEETAAKTDEKSKKKRQALGELQKQSDDLEKELKNKQRLVKEGNRLLQLFVNDDDCLYCREKRPSKAHSDHLNWMHEENRKLTEKLADLFRRETEYEKVSSKQIEELRNTLEISSRKVENPGLDKTANNNEIRRRTDSQSSKHSFFSKRFL